MSEFISTGLFTGGATVVVVGGVAGSVGSTIATALMAAAESTPEKGCHLQISDGGLLNASNCLAHIYVLAIDAGSGLGTDARRQLAMARTAGYAHIVIACDIAHPAASTDGEFAAVVQALAAFAERFEFASAIAIPVSVAEPRTLTDPHAAMSWYDGPSLLGHLRTIDVWTTAAARGLRLPIEAILRPEGGQVIYKGRISSGVLRKGDALQAAHSGQTSSVADIVGSAADVVTRSAGEDASVTIAGDINLRVGDVLANPAERPHIARQFAARVACVGKDPVLPGREYTLKLGGQVSTASITAIKYAIDLDTLRRDPRRFLAPGEVGTCVISAVEALAIDDFEDFPETGRFVLSDRYSGAVVAAGTVDFALRRGKNVHWQSMDVSKDLRAVIKRQRSCIVWFTGLSGSGKSTVANALERELVRRGHHTYLLDGDNVRHGLNKDLGFTAADRVENIRRVGEVAKLFVDAGLIVLCSFISPFRAERAAVRDLVDGSEFIEVHVNTPIEVCEARDVKGLYAKARRGGLPNFTGIDSPYEAPEKPDVVIDCTTTLADESAARLVTLLEQRGILIG